MKRIVIDENGSGERIDKFLKEEFFLNEEITRGEIIRNIREGNIRISKKTIKPSYLLREGDVIEADLQKEKTELVLNSEIDVEIVFQNKDMIVVNKPAGVQTHPSDSEKKNTLVNWLIVKYPEIISIHDGSANSWMRPGIVHRLDKETSGIMVVARNQKTFDELKKKFANREITKNYVALIYGNLINKKGVIDKAIARAASFKKQKIAQGRTKGTARSAVTEYCLIKRYDKFDLVEAIPKTGRMHQIRVHLAFLGHPIVGDRKYKRRNIKQEESIKRHLLHAQKLQFELGGENFSFSAQLPDDFAGFLEGLD